MARFGSRLAVTYRNERRLGFFGLQAWLDGRDFRRLVRGLDRLRRVDFRNDRLNSHGLRTLLDGSGFGERVRWFDESFDGRASDLRGASGSAFRNDGRGFSK